LADPLGELKRFHSPPSHSKGKGRGRRGKIRRKKEKWKRLGKRKRKGYYFFLNTAGSLVFHYNPNIRLILTINHYTNCKIYVRLNLFTFSIYIVFGHSPVLTMTLTLTRSCTHLTASLTLVPLNLCGLI